MVVLNRKSHHSNGIFISGKLKQFQLLSGRMDFLFLFLIKYFHLAELFIRNT